MAEESENNPPSEEIPQRRIVIKQSDMEEEMQSEAIECASQALEKFTLEKDMAAYVKKEFDARHGTTWHCVVGRSFGSFVTHELKSLLYFYIDNYAFLLFKSGF
eukprot:TRINITY_DN24095_c0_g1_i1.p2 TRINITY_DN24095_c0_g1~~TRINITY_DN24095_c0_g1_i1.p2  ORF type:complete len:104 (-),score=26.18 TRINITY_DN24095_c0_g1_i1:512-823(-)